MCVFHYFCRTILQGKTSHKFIDMGENPIMHIYYTNRTVLGFMCLFNELFYAALYLVYFTPGPLSEYKEDFVGSLSWICNTLITFICSSWRLIVQAFGNRERSSRNNQDLDLGDARHRRFRQHHDDWCEWTYQVEREQEERINALYHHSSPANDSRFATYAYSNFEQFNVLVRPK